MIIRFYQVKNKENAVNKSCTVNNSHVNRIRKMLKSIVFFGNFVVVIFW